MLHLVTECSDLVSVNLYLGNLSGARQAAISKGNQRRAVAAW